MSTVEVVGLVTAFASAPSLNGASSTIATNGAESAKTATATSCETTFTPAIFSSAQATTTASPTSLRDFLAETTGTCGVRYATNSVG